MDRPLKQKSRSDADNESNHIPIILDIPQRERESLQTQGRPPHDENLDATPVPRYSEFENLIRQSQQSDFSELIQHVNNLIIDSKGSSSCSVTTTPRAESFRDSMYSSLQPQPLNTASKGPEMLKPMVYAPPSPKKRVRFDFKENTEDSGPESDDTVRPVKQTFARTPLPKTRRVSHERLGADLFARSPPTMPPTPLKIGRFPKLQLRKAFDQNSLNSLFTSLTPEFRLCERNLRETGGYYGIAVGYKDEEGRKLGGVYPTKGNEEVFEGGTGGENDENIPVVGLGIMNAGLDESWVKEGGCRHNGCKKRCSK